MDRERLEKQMAFCLETDKEKFVGRQTYKSDGCTKENDAEHAWHMALMTIILAEYANGQIDVLKTVTMVLIHDLVEIYAGDTYAYDEEGKKTQEERELAAADSLFAILPDDQREKLYGLWKEFEDRRTPEARFARTMDNIQPLMLNNATDGKSWQEKGIRLSQVLDRNEKSGEGSMELWNYAFENYVMPNVEKGRLKDDRQ